MFTSFLFKRDQAYINTTLWSSNCGFRMTFSTLIVFLMYVGLFFFFQDLGLAQNTATNTKTPVPLGSLAHQMYRMMCARGYANKDFSSVFQFLREEEGQ